MLLCETSVICQSNKKKNSQVPQFISILPFEFWNYNSILLFSYILISQLTVSAHADFAAGSLRPQILVPVSESFTGRVGRWTLALKNVTHSASAVLLIADRWDVCIGSKQSWRTKGGCCCKETVHVSMERGWRRRSFNEDTTRKTSIQTASQSLAPGSYLQL